MQFRTFPDTSIAPCSAIGFGLWTISTGWWGTYTEDEAINLMRQAFDLGINFFDAADTYGNGLSEELIPKAFPTQRDHLVIATKVGYDFYSHGDARRGQREIPQNFSPEFIRQAVDRALLRLKTDRIDLLQLHNIRMEQVAHDDLWDLLASLRQEGKILGYGAALGPAIGWLYEGIDCVQQRQPHVLQHIYNMLEPYPGRAIMEAVPESAPTRFLIRVTHSSGMLEGKYTPDTVFPPNDHRSHRPRSWLLNGLKKIERLQPLVSPERTLGQVALLWLLAQPRTGVCLPNIYNTEQLTEFARAPDCPPLTTDELDLVASLQAENFGVHEDAPRFKGTMERATATAA
ncbi:MAG: aldo/keto reductase [Verrucomicrobiia bacterium]